MHEPITRPIDDPAEAIDFLCFMVEAAIPGSTEEAVVHIGTNHSTIFFPEVDAADLVDQIFWRFLINNDYEVDPDNSAQSWIIIPEKGSVPVAVMVSQDILLDAMSWALSGCMDIEMGLSNH